MRTTLLLLTLATCLNLLSQEQVTISGYLRDAKTADPLIGATIFEEKTKTGTVADENGHYSFRLPKGRYLLRLRSLSYQDKAVEITFVKSLTIDFELQENTAELQEVVVSSARPGQNVTSTEMGVARMDIKEIRKMPALMGEVDIIKSIQTLPGVTSAGEGASGFNVRGGNIDQNLILLDEAPVFNSSHLFGMFSIFNPDVVKDLKLMKGSIPAQYGGRTSSVLDVKIKEAGLEKMEVNGGIGTIFSRLSVETPVIADKLGILLAVRRSYIDVLARPFLKGEQKGAVFNFYDLNGKANWTINGKNKIFLSSYKGSDNFGAGFTFNYGNTTTSARWSHVFNDKLHSNITAYYSKYNYFLAFNTNAFKFNLDAAITSRSLKADYTYFANSGTTLRYGAQGIRYTFNPGEIESSDRSGMVISAKMPHQYAYEYAAYVNNEQRLGDKVSLQYGLRWSFYNYVGKGTAFYYKEGGENKSKILVEEKTFGRGENIQFYHVPEPRFAFNYLLSSRQSLKASFTRSAQYLQIVSNTAASTPLDFYLPATNNIRPLVSDQAALGYFTNLFSNSWEVSVEGYYKNLSNQLDYIDNSNLLLNRYLEGDLLQGRGRAYGLEVYAKKNSGRLTGWISYTMARTERKVAGISNSDWFLSKYDRPHNLNVVLMYAIGKRFTLSSNIVYTSGTPSTFFDSKFGVQGYYFPHNSENERGNYRISPYHRVDLGLVYDLKHNDSRRFKSTIAISVYNVYNRRNAFSVYFRNNPAGRNLLDNEAVRFSVIASIVPALTYNFKF